jgi:hypothetical protein
MNAGARLMHEVKIGPRLLTLEQAREVDSLRRGLIPPRGQGLDERAEGPVAIKLMRSRPQDLKAVSKLRQTRIEQAGFPDPRLTFYQHDPPTPHASVSHGFPQDLELVLPTENQPPHCADRIPETDPVKSCRVRSSASARRAACALLCESAAAYERR